ncbi:MAG: 50S ribosomal protein L24 [candidate division SR1 bacterium]|nr:50S ribosomal protein L24 [candidate division SR1 bacterium]
MSISKIQKGDKVKVISGKFNGTLGFITKVVKTLKYTRVSVDSVNKIVKYTKSNKAYGMQGQMTQVDRFIDSSNVALIDEKNTVSKSFIAIEDNKKIRKFRTTNSLVPKPDFKKKESIIKTEVK